MKRKALRLGCLLAMILVLLDGSTAQEGIRQGLNLCVKSVIPALLPFHLLSSIFTDILWGKPSLLLETLGRLFHMPKGSECLLLPAFLGGFPAGAAAVGDAWKAGGLKKEDAERLLGWCNQAGPGFLFGIAANTLPDPLAAWKLWGLLILGALAAAALIPVGKSAAAPRGKEDRQDFLSQTVLTMGKICVTVMAFRVMICYIDVYLNLHGMKKVLVGGLLELTNGCCDLPLVSAPYRMIVAALLLSLGGLCVLFQTRSVTQGLSLKWYLVGKGIQAFVCLLGTWKPRMLIFALSIVLFLKLWVAFSEKRLYNKKKFNSGGSYAFPKENRAGLRLLRARR